MPERKAAILGRPANATDAVIPARNRRDWDEIPEGAKQGLEFVWCERVDDALAAALADEPRVAAAE